MRAQQSWQPAGAGMMSTSVQCELDWSRGGLLAQRRPTQLLHPASPWSRGAADLLQQGPQDAKAWPVTRFSVLAQGLALSKV